MPAELFKLPNEVGLVGVTALIGDLRLAHGLRGVLQKAQRLLETGDEKELIERAARERLGYVYPDEQVFIDPSGN